MGLSGRSIGILAGSALASVLIVFGRSLPYPFVYDDRWTIVENPSIRSLRDPARFFLDRDVAALPATGMTRTIYRPLPTLSFAVDRWLGLGAGGMRFINFLLHVINGTLVLVWLNGMGLSRAAAGLGAAVFLFHPAQVESVVWVTQRSNLLACLGVLGALAAFARGRFAWGFGGLALGLVSKETAAVFPALLAGQDLLTTTHPWPKRRRQYLGVIVILAAYLALRFLVVGPPVQRGYQESGPLGHLLIGQVSWLMYLRILALPLGLRASYFQWFDDPWSTPWTLAGLGAGLAWAALLVRAWRADRRLGFFLAWVPVTLAPVLGLFPTDTFVAERFLYVPMVGVAGAAAWAFSQHPRRMAWALGAIVLALSVLAWRQTGTWKDELTLWTTAVGRDPRNAFARACRAQSLDEAGSPREAETDYVEALRMGLTRSQAAAAMTSLSRLRWEAGDPAGALTWAQKALRAEPALVPAFVLKIRALNALGRAPEARSTLDEARTLHPGMDWERLHREISR